MSLDPVAPDATASTAPRVPGYTLGERVGRGGSGSVWAATRLSDGLGVAVKVVPVAQPAQAHSVARELAVLGRVGVEGLVGFHEAVGLDSEPPAVALVLDRLDGGTLEAAVRARGHLSVGESVTVLVPVARALAGLHALGVVHGDVTPANVVLALSGRPFLTDLGVARLTGEHAGRDRGYLWGTAGFVAPEVLTDGFLTTAADVYAVGALAWWCVTGRAPEPGAVRAPLAEVAPGLPAAWSEVTTRALLGDPALRPTAAELALAYYDSAPCEPLRLVVGSDETSLLTQRLRRPPVPLAEPVVRGRRDAARRFLRERVAAVATLAALVVALGVGGLVAADVLDPPGWVGRQGPGSGATQAVTPVPTDPVADPTAPGRDPLGLMVALAALRAEAMNKRSRAVVGELDAPGSGALAQDAALLADLTASGTSWQGVRFEVTDATTVLHREGEVTVDAVVGTAAYRVVSATGEVRTRAAVPGLAMRFVLVWSGGRWRVDRVSEPEG
ncbi:serine/threonine-protein kinase [Pedococcus bigeumensis]|uniref:serine/threonine-protein kinase n=1 Tax=Pedococcus bigeumensis TaxID=433644 RepID=UPI002FE7BCCD